MLLKERDRRTEQGANFFLLFHSARDIEHHWQIRTWINIYRHLLDIQTENVDVMDQSKLSAAAALSNAPLTALFQVALCFSSSTFWAASDLSSAVCVGSSWDPSPARAKAVISASMVDSAVFEVWTSTALDNWQH